VCVCVCVVLCAWVLCACVDVKCVGTAYMPLVCVCVCLRGFVHVGVVCWCGCSVVVRCVGCVVVRVRVFALFERVCTLCGVCCVVFVSVRV